MNVLANQLPSFLGQQFGQQDVANITVNGSEFVNTILSSAGRTSPLMQGFVFLYRLLEQRFGLDPSLVLTTFGLFWGFTKMFTQFYTAIKGFVDSNLRCSITITENDTIYDHLMKWLSMQPAIKSDRYLMAQTVYPSAWENDEEDLMSGLSYTDGGDSEGQYEYLNFSNQAAKSTPRYVPAMGSTKFWHNGTYFRFTRKRESLVNSSGFSPMRETEEVSISCYGRSVVPLKRLIADAKATYFEDTHHRTTVYRPRAKEYRRDYNLWQQITSRPVRPMRTVVLNTKEKHEVLSDINEYLHPSTPRWYASRGIPLRRGYLFHGPPGTGKTSFSFALAGVFGIDIYVISLQDVNVTEEDLAALFAKLPRRCIVLLEDIDTAGLKRNEDEGENKVKDETSEEKEDENEGIEGATKEKKLTNGDTTANEGKNTEDADKKIKKKSKKSKRKSSKDSDDSDSDSSSSSDDEAAKKKKKDKDKGKMRKKRIERVPGRRGPGVATISMETISLSGLLNAIDGVASHEGRVLIMTTNKPESLDEALVRPGRVDLQVGFTNASKHQAMDLFVRMYEGVPPPRETRSVSKTPIDKETGKPAEAWVGPAELKKIADEFSEILPEGKFSPAEIQGFLLKRKKSPRRALDDAPGWIEATMKQKDSKSKVMTVQ